MAGAVFFLSERTRAAAAAAAILPSAVAAISSLRIGARIKSGSETSHFQVRGVEGRWVKRENYVAAGPDPVRFVNFSRISIMFLKDSSVECGFT